MYKPWVYVAAYGFSCESLNFIRSYLTDRRQRIRINHTYSPYSDVTCGVLEGSILGPVLFNIDICVIFHLNSSFDIASLADDNTPYISDPTEDLGKTEFEISCTKLLKWFRESRKSNSYVISWLHHVIPSELTLKVISIIVQKKNCL